MLIGYHKLYSDDYHTLFSIDRRLILNPLVHIYLYVHKYSPCNLLPQCSLLHEHNMEFNFIFLIEKGQDWLKIHGCSCLFFFKILFHLKSAEIKYYSIIIYCKHIDCMTLLILRSEFNKCTAFMKSAWCQFSFLMVHSKSRVIISVE